KTIEENKKTIEENKKTIEENKKTIENSILSLSKYIKDPNTIAVELKISVEFVLKILNNNKTR
ncbi:MAG: hypothetical protein QM536_08745, partial [Chitinophagaceae bacterium]|nr:hypothetical protein [Chitinophagaceae bacterium]